MFATKEFWQPSPAWRWHGLGMLQRELSESTRIHVWHPLLVKVPAGFRRVHDHRFDLTSLVLAGEFIDRHYDVQFVDKPGDANTWMWSIIHAKIQRGASDKASTQPTAPGDDPDVESIGRVFAKVSGEHRRLAGEVYQIERGAFHETQPMTLAITLVSREKFHRDRQARVLGETAHSAIAGQHHSIQMDESIVASVLKKARAIISYADDAATDVR